MQITVAGLLLAVLMISCEGSDDSVYVNHERWETSDLAVAKLKARPKEVTETVFTNLADTTLETIGGFEGQRTYQYDSSGQCVFERINLDSMFIMEMYFNFSPEGVRTRYVSYNGDSITSKGRNEAVAVKIGKNKYKVSNYENDKKIYDNIETFVDGGNTKIVERSSHGKVHATVTTNYENSLIKKRKKVDDKGISENTYHYSSKGFLDSITIIKDGARYDVSIYFNNEHGDPVLIIQREGHIRMKYVYDEKGNWVKRLLYLPMSQESTVDVDNKFPGYSLSIREIKY